MAILDPIDKGSVNNGSVASANMNPTNTYYGTDANGAYDFYPTSLLGSVGGGSGIGQIITGTAAPTGATGSDTDLYYQIGTSTTSFWGQKASGAWPSSPVWTIPTVFNPVVPTISTAPFAYDSLRQYGSPSSPLTSFPSTVDSLVGAVVGGRAIVWLRLSVDPSNSFPSNWVNINYDFAPSRLVKLELEYEGGADQVVSYVAQIVRADKPTISNLSIGGADNEGSTKTVFYDFASSISGVTEVTSNRVIEFYFDSVQANIDDANFFSSLNAEQSSNSAGFALGAGQVGQFGRVSIIVEDSDGTRSIRYNSARFGPIAATAAFTPASLNEVVHWFDFTDQSLMTLGAVQTQGQEIATMQDKITNPDGTGDTSYRLTQPSAANRFLFASENGASFGLSRSNNSRFFTDETGTGNAPSIAADAPRECWFIFSHPGTQSWQKTFFKNNAELFSIDGINGQVGHGSVHRTGTGVLPANAFNYVRFYSDGAGNPVGIDVNGTNEYIGSVNGNQNNEPIGIGSSPRMTITFRQMRVKHILFVNGRLSGQDLADMETWAASQQ